MVVSPVKDKCPKENPDNCKYVYFPYHIDRSGSQLETCRVVNGVESIRSGIHRRPSAPIKASKARSIFLTMSNPHTCRPPLTLSITGQKAFSKLSQAGVILASLAVLFILRRGLRLSLFLLLSSIFLSPAFVSIQHQS
jgi:hypothetical protein